MQTIQTNAVAKLAAMIAVMMCACSEQEVPTPEAPFSAVQPPLSGLEKQFEEYTFNASEGGTIEIGSGTTITIPPLSVIDAHGNNVSGDATLKYREYHDATDVFLSGIPMDFKSQGEDRVMQTAGMFEIRAYQGEQELSIDEGKSITVRFASQEAGTEYNFFRFDEGSGVWSFQDYSNQEVNPIADSIREVIENIEEVRNIPFKDEHFALNWISFLDMYYHNNYKRIMENRDEEKMVRKAEAYGLDLHDLWAGEANLNGRSYPAALLVWKPLTHADFPDWADSRSCEIQRLDGNLHRITVEGSDGVTFSVEAETVMTLVELFSANSEEWAAEYAEYQERMRIEQERLALQAEVFRTVEVMGFGIYNYDKLRARVGTEQFIVHTIFDGLDDDQQFWPDYAFCFIGDEKTAIKISTRGGSPLFLDPHNDQVRVLAVLGPDRIGFLSANDFARLQLDQKARSNQFDVDFELSSLARSISSEDDLRGLLAL